MSEKVPSLWDWSHRKFKESENKNISNENKRTDEENIVFMCS